MAPHSQWSGIARAAAAEAAEAALAAIDRQRAELQIEVRGLTRRFGQLTAVRDATLFGQAIHLLLEEQLEPDRLVRELGLQAGGAESRPATDE